MNNPRHRTIINVDWDQFASENEQVPENHNGTFLSTNDEIPLHQGLWQTVKIVNDDQPMFGKWLTTGKNNVINPDMSIVLPENIIKKLNWHIGTEVSISLSDLENEEVIVTRKLYGKEARESFRKMRDNLYLESND